jgi:hypothetical protein
MKWQCVRAMGTICKWSIIAMWVVYAITEIALRLLPHK